MKNIKILKSMLTSSENLCYNEEGKKRFGRTGKAAMKELAKALGLTEFKVHFNPGGIAGSGDVDLIGLWSEGNGVYVSLNKNFPGMQNSPWGQILYRSVKHMTDWSGGENRWIRFDELGPVAVEKILGLKLVDKAACLPEFSLAQEAAA